MTLTSLVCAVVSGLAVAYAIEEGRRLRSRRLFRYVGRRQALRRIYGSLLVALLMVLVYAGLQVIDPFRTPRRFIINWSVAGLISVLLFALALLDLRELRRNRERERRSDLDRFAEELESRLRDRPGQ